MNNDLVQNTPAWQQFRLKGIGASECAAVLGLSPYMTKHDVWMEKTGRRKGFEGNLATQRGSELEAKARSLYELENMDNITPATAVHPQWPFLRASLDGISDDRKTILEIKVPSKATHEAAKQGVVPEHYMIQIQQQLLVTGADQCHFFTYSADDDSSALVIVKPDLDLQIRIVNEVSAFWLENIVPDIEPPLTDRDTKVINDNEELNNICAALIANNGISKQDLDKLKARAIEIAQHPKLKCGDVRLSTVNRAGKFSYYKLTISGSKLEKTGT